LPKVKPEKVDLFALGMTLLEIAGLQEIESIYLNNEISFKLIERRLIKISQSYSTGFVGILRALLQ
jgi:hypothetical protein